MLLPLRPPRPTPVSLLLRPRHTPYPSLSYIVPASNHVHLLPTSPTTPNNHLPLTYVLALPSPRLLLRVHLSHSLRTSSHAHRITRSPLRCIFSRISPPHSSLPPRDSPFSSHLSPATLHSYLPLTLHSSPSLTSCLTLPSPPPFLPHLYVSLPTLFLFFSPPQPPTQKPHNHLLPTSPPPHFKPNSFPLRPAAPHTHLSPTSSLPRTTSISFPLLQPRPITISLLLTSMLCLRPGSASAPMSHSLHTTSRTHLATPSPHHCRFSRTSSPPPSSPHPRASPFSFLLIPTQAPLPFLSHFAFLSIAHILPHPPLTTAFSPASSRLAPYPFPAIFDHTTPHISSSHNIPAMPHTHLLPSSPPPHSKPNSLPLPPSLPRPTPNALRLHACHTQHPCHPPPSTFTPLALAPFCHRPNPPSLLYSLPSFDPLSLSS